MKNICIIFCCALIFSCNDFDDMQLVGPYSLGTIDILEQTTVYYELEDGNSIGVIPPAIYAVGYNQSFIVAKQHPHSIENGLDRNTTSYFIIPVYSQKTLTPENGVFGPLDENQFKEKLSQLNSGPIEFTIVIDKLK